MIDNCVENNMKSEVIVVRAWWLGRWWYVALFTFACAEITSPLVMFIFSNPGTLSFRRPYINVTSLSSCKAEMYVTNTTDSSSRLTIHVWIMISICLSSPRFPITVTDANNTPPFYNNTTFQGNQVHIGISLFLPPWKNVETVQKMAQLSLRRISCSCR